MTAKDASEATLIGGDETLELSSNRTSLSFARSRMSADRTMMAVARSSLTMMSFGFVIHELSDGDPRGRSLGLGMFVLGLMILAVGVGAYANFARRLSRRRSDIAEAGLLRPARTPVALPVFLICALLLAVGVSILASIVFNLARDWP